MPKPSTCKIAQYQSASTMHRFVALLIIVFTATCTSAAEIVLKPGNLAVVLEQARKAPKPVRIVVADGIHPITETINLGEVDSGVTWGGKNTVFMAGKPITGWQKAEGGLWKAALPDKAWKFEQLWINGRRATLARSPNKGYHHITEAVGAGVFPDLKENMNFYAFSIPAKQFDVLKVIPQVERDDVLLTVTHAWAVGQCRIKALNDESLAVQIKGRARYPFVEFEPDQRFWMENYRAALDAPGEWFLDKAKGELLYLPLPGEDMTKAEIIAPVVKKFIVMKGARDVRFEGISFQFSQYLYPADGLHDGQAATTSDGCIEIEDSSGIQFENCEIAHTGLHGIWFKNGCSDSSVKHCHLHDLGGGGVYVGETKRPQDDRVNHRIVIDDCIIQHGGRLHPSACGVVFTHTQHCEVKHCDIADFYYTGVSAGWNWGYGDTASRQTLVESNHIHHLGWGYLSDMGGYYGLGTSPGTIIRGNHVHHIVSHRYGGWGLYNDEGSTDTLMENNLVHDTWNAGFHQHYGYFNIVRNNIFAFGGSAQIQASRNEPRLRFKYERNIVVWDPEVPLLDGGDWNWKLNDPPGRGEPKDTAIFRNNLYWPTNGKKPALLTKSHYTWDEWLKMGRDSGSIFADPLFEDIGKRDFRIRSGSPAEKIGFKPWDLTVAGVRKSNALWVALAAKGSVYPTWATDACPWPAPPYEVDQDFESVPIGVIGIRNAKYERPREQKNLGEGFGVSEEAASPIPLEGHRVSKRSLKAQDKPGLAKTFDPVLDIYPRWESGTFRVGFDIMAKEGADWFFEMRGKQGKFGDGPYVRCVKGKLVANNSTSVALADIKPGEWCRISITATTGSGVYSVTLTRQDGSKKEFKDLPMKPTWIAADYLLFASLANRDTAYFIDNLNLESLAK
jgi:Right handed beta helix region